MSLENLLRILELKTEKFSSGKIASMLYTDIPTLNAVNRIDVLYSKYKNKAFNFIKQNLTDEEIVYKLFLSLVTNNEKKLQQALKIIKFWRSEYNRKMS
jgi:hypothetical protein